jgi:5S rRNA maturation endonuclease (ribonuclease M5)
VVLPRRKHWGDAIALIRFATGCDYKGAFDWLRSHGYESFLGERPTPKQTVAEYDYTDENGARLYQVVRFEPKDFRQRRSDGNGGWVWKGPERPVPYKLPELIASGTAPVLIAGGEKDVDNLRALGFTATCNHGGEGKWPELTPYLKDRRVFILCDNDEQGEKHQQVVGAALNGVASEIRVVRFPELPAKGDVSDWIALREKEILDRKAIYRKLAERIRDEVTAWEPTPCAVSAVRCQNAISAPIGTIGTEIEWPEADLSILSHQNLAPRAALCRIRHLLGRLDSGPGRGEELCAGLCRRRSSRRRWCFDRQCPLGIALGGMGGATDRLD